MIELNKLLKVLEKACAATKELQGQILDDITVDRLSCEPTLCGINISFIEHVIDSFAA